MASDLMTGCGLIGSVLTTITFPRSLPASRRRSHRRRLPEIQLTHFFATADLIACRQTISAKE
jgi:hypothetical protein